MTNGEADYGRIGELRSALNTLCERMGFRVVKFQVQEYLGVAEGEDEDGNPFASDPEIEIELIQVEQ